MIVFSQIRGLNHNNQILCSLNTEKNAIIMLDYFPFLINLVTKKKKTKLLIATRLFMKILEIKVLRGPNYWSIRRTKLIQMKIDLEEMEQRPTNSIPGFRERLEKMFPSLYDHRCSEGTPGGFFKEWKKEPGWGM